MPIYEYVCGNGHRFDVIHGIHDAGPTECPVCQSTNVRKAFVPPAIHFKGSGWAKKDRSATSKPGGTPTDAKPTDVGATSSETPAGDTSPTSTTTTKEPVTKEPASKSKASKGDAD
jgi:putative FmdB family regulatory protein